MKKKLNLGKMTIANLGNKAMNDVQGGAKTKNCVTYDDRCYDPNFPTNFILCHYPATFTC